MSKQDTDINQLLSFLTSPVSNQNKVSFESFNDLFIPIKKSISEENRRLTKLQNNTVISNKSNRYRTLNSQPKQILTIKEEPKSTIIIHTEPGTNRIRFGRTEGEVMESPDKIALKREIKHDYEEIKDFKKQSNFYTFQPIKERCMEIIEDFQSNLKRINSSLAVLQAVNHHMDKFTSKQNTIIKRLQHNVLSLKKFYVLIENCQESFGTLVNYDKKVLLDELGNNYYSIKSSIRNYSNNLSQTDTIKQKRTNTYLQSKESLDGKYLDNILQSHCYEELLRCKNDIKNYQVSADEVQDHFTELFLEPNKNQFAFFNKGHIKWNTSKSVIYPKGKCLTCQ